jgi:hypothetical protein
MQKAHEFVTTGTPKHHDIPCATVLTAYTCSPWCAGLLANVARGSSSASLTPASGCQDHTILPSAISIARLTMRCVHRIPRPTLVTVAKRPSGGHGMRQDYHTFLKNGSQILAAGGRTIQVPELSTGIGLCAHTDSQAKRPAGEASSQKIEH